MEFLLQASQGGKIKMKFLRRDSSRYSKLGKKRKKKQIWRKPTGRDNKMREKRKGYPAIVGIGHRTEKKSRDTINKKKPVLINSIKDLENFGKKPDNKIAIIGSVGKKKKINLVKKAKEMKIKINNLKIEKFLKNAEKIKKVVHTPKETKKKSDESGENKK